MQDNKIEYLSEDAWYQWHTELLQSTVNRVYNRVPFYRKSMEELGITPRDINSAKDLTRLPFTTRKDLSDNYPYNMFAVPLRDIVRIHTLRGSREAPVVLGYTRQDLEHRKGLASRFLMACGVTPDDIIQICLDPGMYVLGHELKEGAEAIGALVIPPDPIHTPAQLRILLDFKTTVLITSPSYGRHLLGSLDEAGISLAGLSLKTGIFVAETLDNQTREELEQTFSIKTISGYGILEAVGPGMAYECEKRSGLHLALDHFIPEIINPDTGEQLPPGQTGELVITTVTTRANPLLRFRTGDLTHIDTTPCACGRTTWRMAPVQGRSDEIISVRGIRIDPTEVDSLLDNYFHDRLPGYLVILKNHAYLERVEVWIALGENLFSGDLPELHRWIRGLERTFKEVIGLECRVRPVEMKTLKPYLDKGQKIVRM